MQAAPTVGCHAVERLVPFRNASQRSPNPFSGEYIRVLLYSHYTTITGGPPHVYLSLVVFFGPCLATGKTPARKQGAECCG